MAAGKVADTVDMAAGMGMDMVVVELNPDLSKAVVGWNLGSVDMVALNLDFAEMVAVGWNRDLVDVVVVGWNLDLADEMADS
ncbi:hypothetical protein [Ureibacillus sinduriensis]|uniref:hypothetical protein n=1 Tax=Ureibacillus sinduriensis TaxID=561440 RepID=UPI000A933CC7|nr:hypothetical protein [Ureibacillus sinduriensis]